MGAGRPHFHLACTRCAAAQADAALACETCGGTLRVSYDQIDPRWDDRFPGSIWRFWRMLPIADPVRGLSLGEGDTPLVRSRAVSEVELLWKDESRNPTGSHKDRALAVAVTHAL
ncbi:MAG: pyridoxal-phosphate dependent enzyme, partial [Acetobacteraceae bacterium]|nr:pyridoxal-phosphate dependent enzyme [Acetobacteraceae bacterium]